MSKTLVIPDIHGDYDLLTKMVNENPADRIIQLGDLANCVWGSQEGDVLCLKYALEHNFEMLVGNHEYPYLGGEKFAGFAFIPEVKDAIKKINWKVATSVDDYLITHAGLHPEFNIFDITDPHGLSGWLNELWDNQPTHAIFANCGRIRWGSDEYGGILWRDFEETSDNRMLQMFGHSHVKDFRFDESGNICIDCKKGYVFD